MSLYMPLIYLSVWKTTSLRSRRFPVVSGQRKTKEWNGIFGYGRAKNGTRASALFYSSHFRRIFSAFFDFRRFSFFAPKPHGKVCYAG